MNKVIFEDLPSTNTPINASNLNLVQNNIENEINGITDKIVTETSYKSPFHGCYIRKYNGCVEMKIDTLSDNIAIGGWEWSNALGQLPVGYRPKMQIVAPVFAESTSSTWIPITIEINNNGNVLLRNRSANSVTINKDHFCIYIMFAIGG